ncbi:MAG: thermonuclease family protein [Cyanobacteria bacterium J06607_15]
MGVELKDYLRSLIAKGNGTIHILPIEQDRYGRTVAELWIPIKPDYEGQIHLNTAMVEAGIRRHCSSRAKKVGWRVDLKQLKTEL